MIVSKENYLENGKYFDSIPGKLYTVDHLAQTILTVEDHSEDMASNKTDEITNMLNDATTKYLKEFFGENS